jgi:hypothetical protein
MNPRRIVIDGKVYNSVDEMPEDVRQQYEKAMSALKDQNGNKIPDAFENNNMLADNNRNGIPDIIENTPGAPIFANAMKILVDGKEFNSLDDLPPEARLKYEKAMGMLDKNQNGIPDFVEGMMSAQQSAAPVSTAFESPAAPAISPTSMPVTPTITPDTSNGWMLALLGVVLLMMCVAGAAGVWYFFLR